MKINKLCLFFVIYVIFTLLAVHYAAAQTFIQGPALIEGVTSTATAAGTTTLTKNSQTNQRFTGVTTQTVVLPDATTLPVGRYFQIENRSTGLVTVQTSGGGALTTVLPDMQKQVLVLTIGSAAGTWDVTNLKIDLADVANVTGILAMINGGTNKAMTASAGSVAYSDADSLELTAVGSSGNILISNGTSAPSFVTPASILDGTYWKQGGNTFGTAGILGTFDAQDMTIWSNSVARLAIRSTGAFDWSVPAAVTGTFQLGTSPADTNDIRIARGSTGLTPFDGSPLKVSNVTSETAARSQYGGEFVTTGQNGSNTTTRYGGLLGVGFHNSAFNLTATDLGLVGVIGLSRATGSSAAATITNAGGGSFIVGNDSTNQVITNAYGVRTGMDGSITNTTGGVTNLFGYYMRDQTAASTFDGAAITGLPAATLRWGLYLNDPSQNYLNGSLLIGQLSSTVRTTNQPASSNGAKIQMTGGAAVNAKFTNTATGVAAGDGLDVGIDSSGNSEIRQRENLAHNVLTNNTQRMQVGAGGLVAIGSTAATTSAKLDIQGTDGALLVPRLTTAQKTALTATAGMEVYDTDLSRMECYDGAWKACSSELTTKGDLATYSTTDTRIGVGTNGQVLTADSSTGTGLLWANNTAAPDSSADLLNLGITTSVGSSALTITLTDKAGSTPSAGSPVKIGFRNATFTTGNYTVASATAATTMVVSSGSTLGTLSGIDSYIYVYALNNAGTIELAVSRGQYIDEGRPKTTTAEGGAGGADASNAMYSTTARTDIPIRLIGRILVNEATAGTWATNSSLTSVVPFIYASVISDSTQQMRIAGVSISAACAVTNDPTNLIASCSLAATSQCTCTFNIPFAAAPVCSGNVTSNGNRILRFNADPTTTGFISQVATGSTDAASAQPIGVICWGPR